MFFKDSRILLVIHPCRSIKERHTQVVANSIYIDIYTYVHIYYISIYMYIHKYEIKLRTSIMKIDNIRTERSKISIMVKKIFTY